MHKALAGDFIAVKMENELYILTTSSQRLHYRENVKQIGYLSDNIYI